jgi:succinyl-CoA synthetase beta subunit
MRLLEYHAKKVLNDLKLPSSFLVKSEEDIETLLSTLNLPFVLKAQVLVGGRGKAGGIQIASTKEEAASWCQEKLRRTLKDHQIVAILAEELVPISTEYYLAFIADTTNKCIKMLFSPSGGVDIEENESDIHEIILNTSKNIEEFKIIECLSRANVPKEQWNPFIEVIKNLYGKFFDLDCSLLEINPLVWTNDRELVVLDSHIYIDDNSIFEHSICKEAITEYPKIYPQLWYKMTYGFDLVMLNPEGNVGLLTSGAGLTMAAIDEMNDLGISPINFADIRTGLLKGDPTRLIAVLEKLKLNSNLDKIFVNIFGGVTDLVSFAETLVKARNAVKFFGKEPEWVIRLEGNNKEEAHKIIQKEGLFVTTSLDDALAKLGKGA